VIAEILKFDENVRDMVSGGRLDQLKAREKEGLSLKKDVSRLIKEGVTSFEEAERIVG
jgi:type II secretory ATPase GspE/PulE/Tfp pilus assembly ATPase PilB-like protein